VSTSKPYTREDVLCLIQKAGSPSEVMFFHCGNFEGINLSNINLHGADLLHANLKDADLSGADLQSANLSGADLSGANLAGAKVMLAHLLGAVKSLRDTTMPDGTRHP